MCAAASSLTSKHKRRWRIINAPRHADNIPSPSCTRRKWERENKNSLINSCLCFVFGIPSSLYLLTCERFTTCVKTPHKGKNAFCTLTALISSLISRVINGSFIIKEAAAPLWWSGSLKKPKRWWWIFYQDHRLFTPAEGRVLDLTRGPGWVLRLDWGAGLRADGLSVWWCTS